MNQVKQPSTGSLQLDQFKLSDAVVSHRHQYAVITRQAGQQSGRITNYRPGTIVLPLRPRIIIKLDHLPATALGSICNDLAMAAGPKNRQSLQVRGPVNLVIVASPSALIPSRSKTFLMVRKSIFRSSQNDRWSTYQTSSLNFSSQLRALRPLI